MSAQGNRSVEILIVDPDVDFARVIAQSLDAEGYVCRTVTTAEAAIQASKDTVPTLIIMETDLANTSGFECYRQIVRDQPWQEISVLFISSNCSQDVVSRSREVGGIYLLGKPIDSSVLLELVGKALWMPQLIRRHLDHGGHSPLAKGPRLLIEPLTSSVDSTFVDATLADFGTTS